MYMCSYPVISSADTLTCRWKINRHVRTQTRRHAYIVNIYNNRAGVAVPISIGVGRPGDVRLRCRPLLSRVTRYCVGTAAAVHSCSCCNGTYFAYGPRRRDEGRYGDFLTIAFDVSIRKLFSFRIRKTNTAKRETLHACVRLIKMRTVAHQRQ